MRIAYTNDINDAVAAILSMPRIATDAKDPAT